MNVEPSAGVHEGTGVAGGKVTFGAGNNTVDLDLTWGKQVYARDGLVSNSDLALDGVGVEALEAVAVVEDGLVGRADGQLDSVELGHDREVTALVCEHLHTHAKC